MKKIESKINELKSWFFKMISKIEKPITKDIRKKQRASDKYQE
jgi:hypothetical protein